MEGSVGLREAFESCQRLTRASRTNFYYPFLLLPARRREALISVYAFCRATDDLADEPDGTGSRAERIAAWRQELARTYEGRPGQSITRSLRSAILRFHLPKAHFDDLINGVEMDTIQNRYPTFQGLYTYCYRVASAVGLICIEIFGYRDLGARRYAEDLGVALQLTNILRDVSADAARDRIYLPLEDLEKFGCTEEEILAGSTSSSFEALMQFECDRARSYYRKAWRSLPRVDRSSLLAAEAMGRIYYEILRSIERRGYDVYSDRVRIPAVRKAGIAAEVWLRKLLGLSRGWPPGLDDSRHEPRSHREP
ncbi:MAG: presqualene diphosphate synthase HpnD [Planctomycetota bacterium]|nr:presqualene diphosphate synthase HpnD [Planctomycetota bacterium]